MAMIRLMDLVLIEMICNILRSQENCLSQKNQKAKKRLNFEIWLSQKKSCQKVRIQLILMLQKPDQSF